MIVKEIERATNRITGQMMFLCERPDGSRCLMINGINAKNGPRAEELFRRLAK